MNEGEQSVLLSREEVMQQKELLSKEVDFPAASLAEGQE